MHTRGRQWGREEVTLPQWATELAEPFALHHGLLTLGDDRESEGVADLQHRSQQTLIQFGCRRNEQLVGLQVVNRTLPQVSDS